MTQQDEKKWRELCNQAIAENDPNKLLHAWLAANRNMEQEASTTRARTRIKSLLKDREASRPPSRLCVAPLIVLRPDDSTLALVGNLRIDHGTKYSVQKPPMKSAIAPG